MWRKNRGIFLSVSDLLSPEPHGFISTAFCYSIQRFWKTLAEETTCWRLFCGRQNGNGSMGVKLSWSRYILGAGVISQSVERSCAQATVCDLMPPAMWSIRLGYCLNPHINIALDGNFRNFCPFIQSWKIMLDPSFVKSKSPLLW